MRRDQGTGVEAESATSLHEHTKKCIYMLTNSHWKLDQQKDSCTTKAVERLTQNWSEIKKEGDPDPGPGSWKRTQGERSLDDWRASLGVSSFRHILWPPQIWALTQGRWALLAG